MKTADILTMTTFIRSVTISLQLTDEERARAVETVKQAAEVYNLHSKFSVENKVVAKRILHEKVYREAREAFPNVPSAMVQTMRDNAIESVKSYNSRNPKKRWSKQPLKKATSSIRYNKRLFTLRGSSLTFSTIDKRIKTQVNIPAWFTERYPEYSPQSASLRVHGRTGEILFTINYVLHTDVEPAQGEVVGLDRGLYTIVTTSRGEVKTASEVRAVRRRYLYNRRMLQQKGTPSAKRKLRAMSGREKRFMRDINHQLTKELAQAKNTSTYVLEDLNGIRNKRRGKKMNTWLGQWAFSQFETFLTYKAQAQGISVVYVDPRYTSQKCNACKNINKASRIKGRYTCVKCGYKEHADVNAAYNIRDNYLLTLEREAGSSQRAKSDETPVSATSAAPRGRA